MKIGTMDLITELTELRDRLDSLILLAHEQPVMLGAPRSSRWAAVRDGFLEGKRCSACGGTKELVAHHRIPFHVDPSLELELSNLIPLCEAGRYGLNCHLLLGHLGNWRRWNVELDVDVQRWASVLIQE